jgi:hypothetical protein
MSDSPMTTACGAGGRPGGERGAVTTMLVILAVGMVLMAGLVFDGGMILVANRRAINPAEPAARAGAQHVNVAAIRAGGPHLLDPAAAQAAALAYLRGAGYPGTAQVDGDTVEVMVAWSQPTTILRLGGIGAQAGTVTARARSVHGVTTQEP